MADGRELFYFDDADSTLARRAPPRRAGARPPPRHRHHAAGRAHRRLDLGRVEPQQPRVPAARRTSTRSRRRPPRTPPRSPTSTTSPSSRTAPPRSGPDGAGDPLPAGRGYDRAVARRSAAARWCASAPRAKARSAPRASSRIRTVIEAWADRTRELSALPGVAQVFPFENRGEAIGVTLGHPHGQIYAYPFVTPRTHVDPRRDRRARPRPLRAHPRARAGRPARRAAGRALDRLRAVRRPLARRTAPAAAPPGARHRRARTRRSAPSSPPSSSGCCSASTRSTTPPPPISRRGIRRPCARDATTVRLMLQITSPRRAAERLKFLAGSEAAMGAWVADIVPEDAAARLREAVASV